MAQQHLPGNFKALRLMPSTVCTQTILCKCVCVGGLGVRCCSQEHHLPPSETRSLSDLDFTY